MGDVIFMGPPGSGKGTAGKLIEMSGLAQHISTGDIIREYLEALPMDHPLTTRIASGEYMTDDEIFSLLIHTVERSASRRIVYDGFPRTNVQIDMLDRLSAKHDRMIQAVVFFAIPDHRIVERIVGRYNCRECQRVYHDKFNPAIDSTCECGSQQFVRREDDNETVLASRLKRYHFATEPILGIYRQRGILHEVNADQPIEKVLNDVLDQIA